MKQKIKGDIRAINLDFLDRYLLKSQDVVLLFDGDYKNVLLEFNISIIYDTKLKAYRFERNSNEPTNISRYLYDILIECLGFDFNFTIFNQTLLDYIETQSIQRKKGERQMSVSMCVYVCVCV